MVPAGPNQPWQIPSRSYNGDPVQFDVDAINQAAADAEWLVFCFHDVKAQEPPAGQNMSAATLNTILAAAQAAGMDVVTMRDVMRETRVSA